MSSKEQDRTKEKNTLRRKSVVTAPAAGFVAAMFVMSIGMVASSISQQQQQSVYAHPNSFDPGAQIFRISTQSDGDEENDDGNKNGENSEQQEA